ncbi:Na+/H+ antiporter [Nonomuraea sp. NPDC003804]|uniref:Na+/H+ antiporter n=1 Tax=Nonomuraea sp. NPDC003804 TaxID=3154547 RepID=UPI0033BEFEDB
MGDELFFLALAVAVALVAGRVLARRLLVPEAILLVAFGLLISLLPGVDDVRVDPEIVLNLFLPPLVFHAAFLTAPRETRADAGPIAIMAFTLTCATALVVAAVTGWAVPGLPWAAALALGAAVAPTDPVAATAVLKRVGAPRRLVTILEGESLVNDGVALTMFGLALAALDHPVTAADTLVELVKVVAGGILWGIAVAGLVGWLRPLVKEPGAQIVLSLVTPFVAYLPAVELGLSGVLATIVVGFRLGTTGQGLLQPASRLTGQAFWEVLVYLLESTLFVLLGLEITDVFGAMPGQSWSRLLVTVVAVIAVVVLLRMFWTLVVVPLLRFKRFETIDVRQRVAMGWAGMRGAITLAIALSIPFDVPNRQILLFLAACVVLATLVGQAATLPWLLRRLGLGESEAEIKEEAVARAATLEAALARIDELAADDRIDDRTADVYRQLFELRLDTVRSVLGEDEGRPEMGKLRKELVKAQRDKLNELYRKGRISVATQRKLLHELDLEERRRASGGH